MSEASQTLETFGATDVGQRKHNEDAYYIDMQLGLSIVADGVGGHDAGEVASAITCEVINREVSAGSPLKDAVRCANREVTEAVEQGRGKAGMASTVVVVRHTVSNYEIAWVGDSRVYLWDGHLKLLTQDHSYVQALLAQGRITLAEARDHPRKNVIVQAIGLQADEALQVGQNRGSLEPGQVLLLCSDGLSDVVEPAQIAQILSTGDGWQDRCQMLVDAAVRAGGRDNITVVLLAGPQQTGLGQIEEPEVVWSFNPSSGEYSGLLEQESSAPAVRRVKPKGAASAPLETTQMMPADEVLELQKAAAKVSRRRRVWWVVLISVVAASLLYSLGLSGIV